MKQFHKVAAGVLLSAMCIAGFSIAVPVRAAVSLTADPVIPQGVTVNGKNVGGMTADEFTQYMEEYTESVLEKNLVVETEIEDEPLTFAASDYEMEWTNPEILDEVLDLIPTGSIIEKYRKIKDVEANPVTYDVNFEFDEESLKSDAYDYMLAHTLSPVEPNVTRVDGQFVVTEGVTGIGFNVEASNESLIESMFDPEVTETALTYVATEPEHEKDIFDNFAGNLLGSAKTNYPAGNPDRDINLQTASNILNGAVVLPGEEYSFLTELGVVTVERGFSAAPVIQNGVYVDELGGGLCQVATTLYEAAMWAEMQITLRNPHSKAGTYCPYSFDAMVYPNQYNPEDKSLDFRFVNNTENPIYIESYCADRWIYFNIYGTEYRPANRSINYRWEVLSLEYENGVAYNVIPDASLNGDPWYFEYYGAANGWSKKTNTVSNPHFKIHSQLWKDVTVDGVTTSELINNDRYAGDTGVMYLAEDSSVTFGIIYDPATGVAKVDARYTYNGTPWVSPEVEQATKQHEENLRKEQEAKEAAEKAQQAQEAANNQANETPNEEAQSE